MGGGGPVLFRGAWSPDETTWFAGGSAALDTCYPSGYLISADNDHPGPPTAPAYSTGTNWHGETGWVDYDAWCYSDCGITVTAGGR